MLALQASQQFLPFGVVAKEQDSGFREGPLEVRVADLLAGVTIVLPGRLTTALDQTTVGDKVLHAVEAGDVVNLVEDGQGQDLADAGNGAEQVEGVMILLFSLTRDEEFQLVEQLVIEIDQGQVGSNAGLNGRIGEALSHTGAVGSVSDLLANLRQVVLTVGVLDMNQQLGSFTHQVSATP